MRFLFTFLFVLFLAGCDVVESSYETYQDAKDDQFFGRGWLPDILPPITTDITTKNDLDLNTSEGGFKIPDDDIKVFINKLSHVSGNKYSYQDSTGAYKWVFTINSNGYVHYQLSQQ